MVGVGGFDGGGGLDDADELEEEEEVAEAEPVGVDAEPVDVEVEPVGVEDEVVATVGDPAKTDEPFDEPPAPRALSVPAAIAAPPAARAMRIHRRLWLILSPTPVSERSRFCGTDLVAVNSP